MDDSRLARLVTQVSSAPSGGAYGTGAYYSGPSAGYTPYQALKSSPHLGTEKHFADLLIFEHRIRQNLSAVNQTWFRYQLLAVSLVLLMVYAGWSLGDSSSMSPASYWVHLSLFAVSGGALAALISSGVYAEQTAQARSFLPRCQRSLANFCLGFEEEGGGQLAILARRRLPAKFVQEFNQFRETIRGRDGADGAAAAAAFDQSAGASSAIIAGDALASSMPSAPADTDDGRYRSHTE